MFEMKNNGNCMKLRKKKEKKLGMLTVTSAVNPKK